MSHVMSWVSVSTRHTLAFVLRSLGIYGDTHLHVSPHDTHSWHTHTLMTHTHTHDTHTHSWHTHTLMTHTHTCLHISWHLRWHSLARRILIWVSRTLSSKCHTTLKRVFTRHTHAHHSTYKATLTCISVHMTHTCTHLTSLYL